MILFVSDMHFGRDDPATERASEADLIACLRSLEASTERLYLLGDVFDQYIEYRTLLPKGFVRFQGFLAEWTDRGVPVTYLAGNHDPWHRDYFRCELGVRVFPDALVEPTPWGTLHLIHGDGLAPVERRYRRLKPWLRHPLPVWIYRTLLPADAGMLLARYFKLRFGNREINPVIRDGLRDHARQILTETTADFVVMGHSHQPETFSWPEGAYLNPGSWGDTRTLGCLDREGLKVLHWNGEQAVAVDSLDATLSWQKTAFS